MPHFRLPSIDHGVISLGWAVGLGAFIYFGMVSVGVSGGIAFITAAVSAFFIFLFVRLYGEDEPVPPPRAQAAARSSRERAP